MKLKKCISTILMVIFLFSITAGPMGCGDSKPTVKDPPLQGDGASINGALLSKVVGGLVDGAYGQVGGDVMGLILNLLGYGGGSGDQSALNAMSAKLDQIVSLLKDIKNQLDQLLLQLKITEEEILANTNDPTNAITQITSVHEELQGLSKKNAGSVDQTTLTGFTNRVENVYNIYAQVNTIHNAILPPTVVKAPVLNNFTDLSINKGNSLMDSYLGLEQYFSQLLYYQLEGVNLIVETKIYRKKAGLPQIDGREAVEMAEKLRPHLVIMDIQMPELDGIAACETIRTRYPETRVVLYSMHAPETFGKEALDKADRFVTKERLLDELPGIIRHETAQDALNISGSENKKT